MATVTSERTSLNCNLPQKYLHYYYCPMQKFLSLPLMILRFWYLEAPKSILKFFVSLNKAFLGVFSLSLMIKTYLRPWKNEYREGLVRFAIFMGIVIKSLFILADLIIFAGLIVVEILLFIGFLIWPPATLILPFVKL
jgi:hypothetical protein